MSDENYIRWCKISFFGILLVFVVIFLNSCTVSMNMVSTKGTASDVIKEDQSPQNTTTPTVSPNFTIP